MMNDRDEPQFEGHAAAAAGAQSGMRIRRETADDIDAIEAVTVAAFRTAPHSDQTEHLIVNALRASGQLFVSLVAEAAGEVIGHVAISPVTLSGGEAHWYGLGPISVKPDQQGKGVGSRLMERGLAELRFLGAAGCVVLGDPNYYVRFGFRPDASLVLPGVPPEYFQVIPLSARVVPSGTVSYHRSFAVRG